MQRYRNYQVQMLFPLPSFLFFPLPAFLIYLFLISTFVLVLYLYLHLPLPVLVREKSALKASVRFEEGCTLAEAELDFSKAFCPFRC
jgi:hypothetical protein